MTNSSFYSYHPSYYQTTVPTALLVEMTRPFHQRLLGEARAVSGLSQSEMAVVWAQVACEQCTEWAITTLFSKRSDAGLGDLIFRWVGSYDIVGSKRMHDLYERLSGDSPNQKPFWQELTRHHERRNLLVHRGQKCSLEEANASVATVDEYIRHIEGVILPLIRPNDQGPAASDT